MAARRYQRHPSLRLVRMDAGFLHRFHQCFVRCASGSRRLPAMFSAVGVRVDPRPRHRPRPTGASRSNQGAAAGVIAAARSLHPPQRHRARVSVGFPRRHAGCQRQQGPAAAGGASIRPRMASSSAGMRGDAGFLIQRDRVRGLRRLIPALASSARTLRLHVPEIGAGGGRISCVTSATTAISMAAISSAPIIFAVASARLGSRRPRTGNGRTAPTIRRSGRGSTR